MSSITSLLFGLEVFHVITHTLVMTGYRTLPRKILSRQKYYFLVDLISFSGDKLIGGPQSGIICGKKKIIKKIHSNSIYRALRCDKFTISTMETTLRTYLGNNDVKSKNLTFKLLTRDRKAIKKLALKALPV